MFFSPTKASLRSVADDHCPGSVAAQRALGVVCGQGNFSRVLGSLCQDLARDLFAVPPLPHSGDLGLVLGLPACNIFNQSL